MKDKAQTISVDALIAVALFMIAVTLFFSMGNDQLDSKRAQELQTDVSKLVSTLSGAKNNSESLIVGSKVSESKITEFSLLNYSRLKDAIGIASDFCIHFEDDEGNIVNVSGNRTGLGTSNVRISGVSCG